MAFKFPPSQLLPPGIEDDLLTLAYLDTEFPKAVGGWEFKEGDQAWVIHTQKRNSLAQAPGVPVYSTDDISKADTIGRLTPDESVLVINDPKFAQSDYVHVLSKFGPGYVYRLFIRDCEQPDPV